MSAPGRLLERLSVVTPLGIQFVDAATTRVVAEPLAVHVYPRDDPQRRAAARPNRIGVFVLPRLPGPRVPEVEYGAGDDAFWRTVARRPFVIEVTDPSGQYQPFTVEQLLPARGLAVPPCLPVSSPPQQGVPLFATAGRLVPAGMAVIRAELMTPARGPDGRVSLKPAAWAVLEAAVGAEPPVRGVADRQGRVAIVLPYPEPAPAPPGPASPPFSSAASLWEQEWRVRLDAFYEPDAAAPAIPDLCRTLAQAPALLWADAAATRRVEEQPLRYGRELVVRSLIVTPAGSPP